MEPRPLSERARRKRRRRVAALGVLVALVAAGAWWGVTRRGDAAVAPTRATPAPPTHPASAPRVDAHAPAGTRIKVEVLNATATNGLARRATMHLRDRGFDVLEVGTSRPTRDSTLVLDRSGHLEWARLVARALGGAAVESRPDSSRYLDVTVMLGADWTAPAQPFYP